MINSIQSLNTQNYFTSPNPSYQTTTQQNYREIAQYQSDTSVSITTDEGDVVTISNYKELSSFLHYDSRNTPLTQGMNFTSASLAEESFSYSVQGDLSDNELLDIENLIDELSLIAGNFFSGNTEKALENALSLSDFGSLAHFDASFSYSAFSHSQWNVNQLNGYHPLPPGLTQSAENAPSDLFDDISGFLDKNQTEEMQYAKMLKAQWQQVKDILEERKSEIAPQSDNDSGLEEENLPAARHMLNRFEKLATKHPRLAPFGVSLAHQAIDRQVDKMDHPAVFNQKNQLKENILKEFNQWILA